MRARRWFLMAVLGLVASVVFLTTGGPVSAAPIIWGAATNITRPGGDSDVDTAGTLVGAFNIGASGVPTTTINGVTFTGLSLQSAGTVTSGNFTFANPIGFTTNNNAGSVNPPFTSLSAPYQALLSTTAGASSPFTLTMNGLMVGHRYEFEWWSNISFGFSSPTTATAINSVILNSNTTGTDGGLGQFAIGTFTADGSSEVITFSSTSTSVLDGLQLRDITPAATAVPEPSTFALLALGGVGLAGWRRWLKRGV